MKKKRKGRLDRGRDQRRLNKNAAIDGWVSQIRNLLTMVRKAIHLDDREERASIDPSHAVSGRRATVTKLSRASHMVSGPRLLKERERDRPPWPFVPRLRS